MIYSEFFRMVEDRICKERKKLWTTKIDVKNMVFTGKVCNNMGKGGKCRKIKGFPELIV